MKRGGVLLKLVGYVVRFVVASRFELLPFGIVQNELRPFAVLIDLSLEQHNENLIHALARIADPGKLGVGSNRRSQIDRDLAAPVLVARDLTELQRGAVGTGK